MKKLTIEEIATLLHNCGLHAFINYERMGTSAEEWNAFRLKLAEEINERAIITLKS